MNQIIPKPSLALIRQNVRNIGHLIKIELYTIVKDQSDCFLGYYNIFVKMFYAKHKWINQTFRTGLVIFHSLFIELLQTKYFLSFSTF